MAMPGMTELLIVFAIVILLFGGKKIPEIARGIGRGIRDFKSAKSGLLDGDASVASSDKKES